MVLSAGMSVMGGYQRAYVLITLLYILQRVEYYQTEIPRCWGFGSLVGLDKV